jgi:hypothetical protein
MLAAHCSNKRREVVAAAAATVVVALLEVVILWYNARYTTRSITCTRIRGIVLIES